MFRTALLSALLISGLSGAAMAANGDTNIEAFMAQQPHSDEVVSQGLPRIVGNQDGSPVIRYSGEATGNLSAGYPVIVGNQDGQPVILYR
jgi:hypothetical protein